MNPTLLLSLITAWWKQLACRMQEARRYRDDLQVLSSMSRQELRDLGISHAQIATAARRLPRCE